MSATGFDLPQPGGREPADGAARVVQDFVNTLDAEHGVDLLRADAAGWLGAHGLGRYAEGGADAAALIAVREDLRALLHVHNGGPEAPDAARRLAAAAGSLEWEVAGDGALAPRASTVAGELLGAAWAAQAEGAWRRLKACPGARCGWAFFDRSRGSRSRWCAMDVCGARAKMARFRAR